MMNLTSMAMPEIEITNKCPNSAASAYAFAAPLRQFQSTATTSRQNITLPVVKKLKKSIIHAEILSS